MTDDNTPKGTVKGPLDEDSGADAINDILEDSDVDLNTDDNVEGQEAEAESDEDIEAQAEDESDEEAEADNDEAEQAEDEESDDSDVESSGGRFVSHDAKVRLPDGSVKTVAELAKSPLLQSDYTRKTQELSEERKSVEQARNEISGFARQLQDERNFLLQFAEQAMPQPPNAEMMNDDPFGYFQQKAAFDEQSKAVQQLRLQAHQAQQMHEQQLKQQQEQRLQQEAEIIRQEMPELSSPDKYQNFWNDTVNVLSEYGFTQQELDAAVDHRFFRVFKDLIRYRKAQKSAPQVREQVRGKPVLKSRKRMDPKAKTTRGRVDRANKARQTGELEDGVAAIMDFDL